ncbi:MAG: PIN domain-containing protein [Pseudomonadota bacterium]
MDDQVRYLVDASGLMAWVNDDAGGGDVDGVIDSAAISAVTLAVLADQVGKNLEQHEVAAALDFGLEILPLEESIAKTVAQIRNVTSAHTLSLENLVVLATGRDRGLVIVTADPAIAAVKIDGTEIQHVRP